MLDPKSLERSEGDQFDTARWGRAFRAGDASAFERAHRRFYLPILSWLRARMDDGDAAEDLAQEVFFKVLRARQSFEAGARFSTWIWTIARNTWKDWIRKRQNLAVDFEEGVHEVVECTRLDPERTLESKSTRRELRRIYLRLTNLQRRVFWLNVVRELPYSEIAEKLGLSIASVKCLAYRTRLALAETG